MSGIIEGFDRGAPSSARPVGLFLHGSADLYGSDRVLLNTLEGLRDSPRFTPVVVLEQDGPLRSRLLHLGIECHVAPVGKIARGMLGWSAPWQLWRSLRRSIHSIDAVLGQRPVRFVYSNTLAVLGGAFWARAREARHLWHVHEIVMQPRWAHRLFPWLVRVFAIQVVCNSNQTRDWLTSVEPGLAGRLHMVANGIATPPAPAPHEREATRTGLQVSADDVLITLVGRLNHMKGQELLLQAAALLRSQGRLGRGCIALVGDVVPGQEHVKLRLEELVDRLQLRDRVRFVPFVQDIYPIWRASDIAVVPSTQPESFGMVAIEAMACGLPVVAAGHGGVLDIVRDGETGLLFPPCNALELANALSALLHDSALRRRLGDEGSRRQSESFDLAQQIQCIRNVLDAVPANKSIAHAD